MEKRFSEILGIVNSNQMPSVVLSHEQHLAFTNAWRQAISYGIDYTVPMIWDAAQNIYQDYPDLLNWARTTIMGG